MGVGAFWVSLHLNYLVHVIGLLGVASATVATKRQSSQHLYYLATVKVAAVSRKKLPAKPLPSMDCGIPEFTTFGMG